MLKFPRPRFARKRFASLRSGRMLGFSSRHMFQTSTPCFNKATCSSSAMKRPLVASASNRPDICGGFKQHFPTSHRVISSRGQMPDWRAAEARQVLSSLGSSAMLAAMRRASSRVSR
jgi:hypothetical protein